MMKCCVLLSVAVLAISCAVSARTWYVLPDSTGLASPIKADLDSAGYGDTVLVAPGTYLGTDDPETWISPGAGVALVSEEGAGVTIIEFCGVSVGIGLSNCEGARVSGFTVPFAPRPGCGFPGEWISGVFCSHCTDVVVENCVIKDVGFGLQIYGESQEWWKPVFRNNIIRDCGTGIRCDEVHEPGRPYFVGNTITDCKIGADIWYSEPNFESCEIMYCRDYGMLYTEHCGGNVDKCVIAHNESYGVAIWSDPPLAAPSFNGSWLPENANDFYDNGSWDIWYAHTTPDALVMAIYNYWGADCPDFASRIYGRVDYSPWMDSAHTVVLTEDDCPGAVEASTWGKIKAVFR